MTKLTEIEGIGATDAGKLTEFGIHTIEGLLDKCATPKGPDYLTAATNIGHKLILQWASRADPARAKGIDEEYADMLEVAGVDAVPEMTQRNAENLQGKMVKVNAEKSLVRQVPSARQATDWGKQEKALPAVLRHRRLPS